MKKTIILTTVTALALIGGSALATPYGTDITIYDGSSNTANWHGTAEDQETEPGMVGSQAWDLEGFFLNGSQLSMVGGFDFKNGAPGYGQFYSGDIFIDVDGNFGRNYGPSGWSPINGNQTLNTNFGYEYVIDLIRDSNGFTTSYAIINLTDTQNGAVMTETAYYAQNESGTPSSDPWQYVSGGTMLGGGTLQYISGLSDADTGFVGGTHYALTGIDLSFLSDLGYNDFTTHFTMGCGNDNLMGNNSTAPVPEPATMFLFGIGLTGFAGIQLRKQKKALPA